MVLKAKELRAESDDELVLKLLELRKEIYQLRSSARLDTKNNKTHLIGQKRREIARILTCQNEKKRAMAAENVI